MLLWREPWCTKRESVRERERERERERDELRNWAKLKDLKLVIGEWWGLQ